MKPPASLPAPAAASRLGDGGRVTGAKRTRWSGMPAEKRAALEARLRRAAANAQTSEAIPLRDPRLPAPLSFAQEQLWFVEQMLGGAPAYHIALVHRLRGCLVAAALESALTQVVARHEALRTTFAQEAADPFQRIHEINTVALAVTDLSRLPSSERAEEARRLAAAQARAAFDLHGGPLTRFHLWKLDEEDHVFGAFWHHLVTDGWSLGVFVRELSAGYAAALIGGTAPLEVLTLQYADFAAWQRLGLARGGRGRDDVYWKERLAGARPLLELPTDRPRPREQAYRGDVAWRTLDERIARRLEDFSRRAGVSQFMTLLAAFKVLLYRYSGQEDVLVGSPFASRPHAALEELIGYFANILVLRTDLSGSPSFAELLRRVRETTVGALEHQDMPFSRLVGLVQPARNPAHHPLFQVQFILQHEALFDHLALPGVQVEPIDVDTGSAKFDLTLQVFERRKGLRLALEFNTDLWDRATAERMLGHYEQVLANALEDQERTIDRLTVLTPREWRMLNEEWNATQLAFPEEALIHELFEAQAGATPGRIAVEFDGHRLTYAELNEAADRLAARLRALGVGPDVLVGLCVGRSLEMIVGVLGILKAGGAYLPLDPTHPRERLDLIVEDARASIIVTQRALLASLPDAAVMHVFLDEEEQSPTPLPFQPRQRRNDHAARTTPSHLAYVLYTSGSTGKPKGVQIEHRAVVNFLTSMRQTPGLCADDVVLAVTTVSFDIAGLEMHLPLTTGARVVIVSGETAADGALLARQIELHSATLLQATPATWRFLLEAGWPGSPRLKALCGGEALPPELARQLLPRCAQLWNMYGPTETTIWSTCCRVRDPDGISIGRPIHNTDIHIVDTRLQPVPAGVPGELLIGGAGLARGYHDRPELTAEKFIAHPFKDSGRLYRTGDLARFRPDGTIECLGRLDHQVKLRGFRIELGEIESALAAHPAVAQAVVALTDLAARGGDKELIAFVKTREGAEPPAGELRSHVAARVPACMVPAAFATVAAFPLNSNGKVDRRALLAAPRHELSPPADECAAPRTALESEVLTIWRRVLGHENGGLRDNFFDAGGHSLLAMRLVREIQDHFDTLFPLRRLLEAPTVERIAAALAADGAQQQTRSAAVDRSLLGSGPGAPLFVIPGLGGFEFIPSALAERIAGERPYFDALQMPGADHRRQPLDRIEDIAASLVRQIREVRAHGPYGLVGFCFGGLVAYEVARQLEDSGEPVGALVLWHAFHAGPWRKRTMLEMLQHFLHRHLKKTAHERRREAAEKARFIVHQTRLKLENLRDRLLGRENLQRMEGIDFLPADVNRALVEASIGARERYQPKPYSGRAYIINGNTDRLRHECPPLGGWQGLLRGPAEHHHLACEHLALLQPPWSEELARVTAACLRAGALQNTPRP